MKECETCQKTKPAPPRSRFSGVRAKEFGDVVFMDHCEIKHMAKKHQLFLVLDGATSLLWGSTQQEGAEPVTQDLFREWMHIHSCKPKWVVADMAFSLLPGRRMVSRLCLCRLEGPLLGQIVQRQQYDSSRGSMRSY